MIAQHFVAFVAAPTTNVSQDSIERYKVLGGKSEHHTAACRGEHAGAAVEKLR
jgi:hypothetical protein